jgi:transposase
MTSKPIKAVTSFERCYGRLKDFRRVAMRYDKLARNFFSPVRLAAIVLFWL